MSVFFLFVFLRTFVSALAWALSTLILVRVILSWVQIPLPGGLSRWIFDVTETVLGPIRRVIPATLGLDISPIVAIILTQLLERVLLQMLAVYP